MAPNLYISVRNMFCPQYWFKSTKSNVQSLNLEEHWTSPVPGTYRHIPGRGWHLVRRDDSVKDEEEPLPTVYCRIVHRHLLASDMQQRCRWHTVSRSSSGKPERLLFFRLDDGYTWVVGWDSKGKFIPGPYRKWCFDKESMTMRRTISSETTSTSTSRNSSIAGVC